MAAKTKFRGSYTALVTPFKNGSVDEAAFRNLVSWQIDEGTHGLVPVGTTGESPTLSHDEHRKVVEWCIDEARGRVPVIAGAGSNSTREAVDLAVHAEKAGADAVLVVTPYYNRPPRAGIVAHVAAIAEVGVPVVLYNIPSRTGLNMEPDLIAELGTIPNVTAVKQANPDLGELTAVAESSGLALYAGNDDMLLPVLERGGAGVISVASHLVGPEMAAIVEAAGRGDMEDARRRDAALQGVNAGLFVTTNPILVKAALEMLGLIPSARLRLPLVEATPVQRDILRTVLEHQGILARA
jgi:4-hydroxy-tetrahydrodipicolinate synthase